MQLAAGDRLGSYEIVARLGAGGMGEVYRARDRKLGRDVAIKLLREDFAHDPERLRRFEREARAASALNHPNIVTIHDIGQVEGRPYIVMEFVDGVTLREAIVQSRLPPRRAIDLARQAAEGLAKAHTAGIVHRDLKPENLMITGDGFLKIVDFGLAKLNTSLSSDSGMTTFPHGGTDLGVIMGTVGYMSPEQAGGRAVDFRSDQFSLGAILYEMATGRRAFQRGTPVQTLSAIIESEPDSLGSLDPNLSAALVSIVGRLLKKDPHQRYQSSRELAEDLRRARDGETVLSGPGPAAERMCPGCGRANPQGHRFCAQCGAALPVDSPPAVVAHKTPSGPMTSGERRPATIVVSQLGGYAALVESLDPGEREELMLDLRDIAAVHIGRHGGTVHQFSSDGVVALFGVPVTHEDDFLLAVRAALALHEAVREKSTALEARLGQSIRFQTGIHTGSVVAELQEKGESRYAISGEAVQVATRLATQAAEDEILVSAETRRLIAPFFETEEGEPLASRGKKQAISTYRVKGESGVRTRLEAAERLGLTAYIGRDRELETLAAALQKSLAGEGQLVTVAGEAGVGKSRLLYEFRRSLEQKGLSLFRGNCQPHGANVPYLPFIDALRRGLEIQAGDSPASPVQGVVGRIRAIDPNLEDRIPLFLNLLSLRSEEHPVPEHLKGEDLRLAMLESLVALFTLAAQRAPAVMILEDWHWTDEASEQVLKNLVGILSAQPLLVITTYRPEHAADWGSLAHHTHLHLAPLDLVSSTRVIESVLGSRDLPEGLSTLLHQRTGGNPFFLEEVCRKLLEEGTLSVQQERAHLAGTVASLHVPESVEAVVRSRLDRLDRDAQEVLRYAAVTGQEFGRKLLERTVHAKLDLVNILENLKKLGLIQQIRVLPEATFRFKHTLTQQVAYESLLLHQRKLLHQEVGEAMEALYSGRMEEHLDRVAHHFSVAEDWPRAVRYGREAAERASRLSEFTEALGMLERTREWLARLPEDPDSRSTLVDLLLRQERLCETLGRHTQQQQLIDSLLALVGQADDSSVLAEVLIRQGELQTLLGRFEEAGPILERSLAIRRSLGDKTGERNAQRSLSFLRWKENRYPEAIEHIEAALALDRDQNDTAGYARDLTNLGAIWRSHGDPRRALAYLEEARALNEPLNNPVTEFYNFHVTANAYRDIGDHDKAGECYQRAYEGETQHLFHLNKIPTLSAMASMNVERGRFEEGLERYRELVALARAIHYQRELSQALATLGQVLLSLDRCADASPHLREAAEIFSGLGDWESAAKTLRQLIAACERRPEGQNDALAAWEKLRLHCQRRKDPQGEMDALEGMARLARKSAGNPARALELYRQSLEIAREIADPSRQGSLLNEMGIIEWSRGDYGAALAHYEAALDHFNRRGDRAHAGLMLNSIGVTLSRLGRAPEARRRLEEALALHRESGERLLESHALAALGDVCFDAGELEEAERHYGASLEIRRAIGDRKGEGWMLHHLARVAGARGGAEGARELSSQAALIAGEAADPELEAACRELKTN